MSLFFLRLCTISVVLSPVSLQFIFRRVFREGDELRAKFGRAYNNPYHPEDDLIIENISDEDGDNLRFGVTETVGQLTDSEKTRIVQRKQKINGRFYDIVKNASEYTYDDK